LAAQLYSLVDVFTQKTGAISSKRNKDLVTLSHVHCSDIALLLAIPSLADLKPINDDQKTGIDIVRRAKQSTIDAICAALEAPGVEFIAENGGGPGVRLTSSARI
jgi:hypothetical protein